VIGYRQRRADVAGSVDMQRPHVSMAARTYMDRRAGADARSPSALTRQQLAIPLADRVEQVTVLHGRRTGPLAGRHGRQHSLSEREHQVAAGVGGETVQRGRGVGEAGGDIAVQNQTNGPVNLDLRAAVHVACRVSRQGIVLRSGGVGWSPNRAVNKRSNAVQSLLRPAEGGSDPVGTIHQRKFFDTYMRPHIISHSYGQSGIPGPPTITHLEIKDQGCDQGVCIRSWPKIWVIR
jgi:hypothetical protein